MNVPFLQGVFKIIADFVLLKSFYFRLRGGSAVYKAYVDALWQWRRVKTSTDTVGQSLEKEFLVDDTAITTTYISRKLDALEKMVRKMPKLDSVTTFEKSKEGKTKTK